jgi:PAS domain S-box-containing protein
MIITEKAFDAIPDLVYVTDDNYLIVCANRAVADALGIPQSELTGMKCHTVFHESEEPPPCCPRLQGHDIRGTVYIEGPLMREGSRYSLSVSPIEDGSGRAIGLLHVAHDMAELVTARDALAASARDKDLVLREIHHRVKNNLMVLASLLKMQGSTHANPEVADALVEAQSRIRTMTLIHEKLYRARDAKHLNCAWYLKSLAEEIFAAFQVSRSRISLTVEAPSTEVAVDILTPCGLLVNELLTNALKHAFGPAERGAITLSFSHKKDCPYVLSLSDTGRGLPEGFGIKDGSTLGMQLIAMLTKQLGGTLEIVSQPGAGAAFAVTFAGPAHRAADGATSTGKAAKSSRPRPAPIPLL